jgi:hypothetical protein
MIMKISLPHSIKELVTCVRKGKKKCLKNLKEQGPAEELEFES